MEEHMVAQSDGLKGVLKKLMNDAEQSATGGDGKRRNQSLLLGSAN